MAQSVFIQLTSAGSSTGPFDIYSDDDAYTTPFETGIAKATLLAGYTSVIVPDGATIIRVQSNNSECTNYVDELIIPPTTTSTTTTTTTAAPIFLYNAYYQICGVSACEDSGPEIIVSSPISLSAGYYSEGGTATVYRITDATSGSISYAFTDPISRTSDYCCA